MDLPLIDLNDGRDGDGLALAARGDWHSATDLFAAELADAERDANDVRLAVALTNLGQSRAQVGALAEAARLLGRSVDVRRRLLAAGRVDGAVVVRGLVDVAAVRAAAGEMTAARDVLMQARSLSDGSDASLMYVIAQGLALLDDDFGSDGFASDGFADQRFADQGFADEPPTTAFADVAFETIDDEPWSDEAWASELAEPAGPEWTAAPELDIEPEVESSGPELAFLELDGPELIDDPGPPHFDLHEPEPPAPASDAEPTDVALTWIVEEPPPPIASTLDLPASTRIISPAAPTPIIPMMAAPSAAASESRWWQRIGRRRSA